MKMEKGEKEDGNVLVVEQSRESTLPDVSIRLFEVQTLVGRKLAFAPTQPALLVVDVKISIPAPGISHPELRPLLRSLHIRPVP
jgi:hypothetical protein